MRALSLLDLLAETAEGTFSRRFRRPPSRPVDGARVMKAPRGVPLAAPQENR